MKRWNGPNLRSNPRKSTLIRRRSVTRKTVAASSRSIRPPNRLSFWWRLSSWCWWVGSGGKAATGRDTDDAEIDGHIYPISARVGGQVVKVNYDDGQVVHKGDVLVQIDPTDYQVALARAQADYQDAQAQAEAAQFGVPVSSVGSLQPDSFRQRRYGLGASRRNRGPEAGRGRAGPGRRKRKRMPYKLNTDVERYRQLLGKREISQQQFDQATAAATAANATVSARQAALLAAQAQVKQAQSRIEQATAEVRNARRRLRTRWPLPRPRRSLPMLRRNGPRPRSIKRNLISRTRPSWLRWMAW